MKEKEIYRSDGLSLSAPQGGSNILILEDSDMGCKTYLSIWNLREMLQAAEACRVSASKNQKSIAG